MRLAAVAVAVVTACTRSAPAPTPSPSPTPDTTGESTTARADYIGPAACGECHPEQHAKWTASLHRVMNARAHDADAVIGDFNAVVHYAGGEARFSHEAGGYFMTLDRGAQHVRYHVTRTIGRRGLQEYVGVAEPASAGRAAADEVRLPFGWWPRRGGWYPQPYYDPWLAESSFDAFAPVTEPWATRCPWCHSTYPFDQRIARAETLHVGHGLEQLYELRNERSFPKSGSERLAVDEQVTTGISCESCHLGGRAHAAGAAIHLVPPVIATKPFAEERRDAAIVNAVCAQCHSGPSPRLADGTALRNSSEAIDLARSPCSGITCTHCHDPHRADARADEARAVAACVGCHRAQAEPEHAGREHVASCLDCHMPRIVMGIDRFVRTHRISSPGEPAQLAATNACNLCHLDRTLAWTVQALRDGWDVRAPAANIRGDDDATAGELWLASDKPAIRLIAAHAYARSPFARGALPRIQRGLSDPSAYVRAWTLFAVEDVLGRRISNAEYDPRAPAGRH